MGRNGVESCEIGGGGVGGCDGMKGGEGDGRDIRSGMFFSGERGVREGV